MTWRQISGDIQKSVWSIFWSPEDRQDPFSLISYLFIHFFKMCANPSPAPLVCTRAYGGTKFMHFNKASLLFRFLNLKNLAGDSTSHCFIFDVQRDGCCFFLNCCHFWCSFALYLLAFPGYF